MQISEFPPHSPLFPRKFCGFVFSGGPNVLRLHISVKWCTEIEKNPRSSPMESFLQPLKRSLWMALFAAVFCVGCFIFVLDLKWGKNLKFQIFNFIIFVSTKFIFKFLKIRMFYILNIFNRCFFSEFFDNIYKKLFLFLKTEFFLNFVFLLIFNKFENIVAKLLKFLFLRNIFTVCI